MTRRTKSQGDGDASASRSKIRLRCQYCKSFLASVIAVFVPKKSVLKIEVNCRNRDCRRVNRIEFIAGRKSRARVIRRRIARKRTKKKKTGKWKS